MAPYFATLLKSQGSIVLAGLIENQVEEVKAAYQPYFEMDGEFTFSAQEDRHWHRLSGFAVIKQVAIRIKALQGSKAVFAHQSLASNSLTT